jgi:anti-anti-sigma regulatory factor
VKVDLQRSGGDAVVVAGGQLTFSHAGSLHKTLLEAFAGASRVELFLHDVHEADLALLQLLWSAHRTAVAQGAVFTVGGLDSASPVRRLIHKSGAERGVGCPEGCLWASAFASESSGDAPAQGQRRES